MNLASLFSSPKKHFHNFIKCDEETIFPERLSKGYGPNKIGFDYAHTIEYYRCDCGEETSKDFTWVK